MCKELIISLDVGKYETKAIGRTTDGDAGDVKRVSFQTKIYDLKKGYIDLEGNSYKINYENGEYIVGEQGIEKSTETSKTNFLHKMCAYTAITQFLESDTKGNKVNIVLACPLSILRVKELKEQYKSYIKGNGEINITVNDKNYSFEIENIMIKAEGSGILYTQKDIFTNKNVAVIDFGGLNMGFSLYRNTVCSPENRFIENFGVNELIKRTKVALENLNDGNLIDVEQVETALNNGFTSKLGQIDAVSIDTIKKVKSNFIHDAIAIVEENGFKLEQYDGICFVGGTTQKLKEQILNKYTNANIPNDSKWTTVEGLYIIACKKYSK